MSSNTEEQSLIDRREAVKRVSLMLGGIALVGGSSGLLTACSQQDRAAATAAGTGAFSKEQIALLDEIADTILPDTAKSPGAKAAQTGAFMALMVTDTYSPEDAKIFRDGMIALDEASKKANGGATFVSASAA
jgi:Gluconate 2-dehydrogenase subunit 3